MPTSATAGSTRSKKGAQCARKDTAGFRADGWVSRHGPADNNEDCSHARRLEKCAVGAHSSRRGRVLHATENHSIAGERNFEDLVDGTNAMSLESPAVPPPLAALPLQVLDLHRLCTKC